MDRLAVLLTAEKVHMRKMAVGGAIAMRATKEKRKEKD